MGVGSLVLTLGLTAVSTGCRMHLAVLGPGITTRCAGSTAHHG